MYASKETKILNTICVILVLLAGLERLIFYGTNISYNSIICALYCTALMIWIWQLRKRLLLPVVRKWLIAVAIMMIFWIVIRTMKYEFIVEGHFMTRYAWYLYYVPMVFVVLFMFLAVLHLGKNYDYPISRWWNLLFIPAFILVAGILTNDIHQMAFRFYGGISAWDDSDNIRGPFYYGVMLWMAVLFIAILVIVFVRCAVPGKRRMIFVPMVPLGIGVLFTLMVVLNKDNILTFMFRVPEVGCIVFVSFMESLILMHLFPTNDSYGDFWNVSSIGAGIIDAEGIVRYKSEQDIPVCFEQIQKAQKEPVLLDNGNIILKSHAINGGFGYWTRNISVINKLNSELADMGDVLAEENAMLDAENKMSESRIVIAEQNKLYDSIAKCVAPQLDKIGEILDSLSSEEDAFEQQMKYVCVLNAYVKRYSNMLLLSHQNKQINSGELYLSIKESLEYLEIYGVKAHVEYVGESLFDSEKILIAYKVYEMALEAGIPGANAIFINLKIAVDAMNLYMEINAPRKVFIKDEIEKKIFKLKGSLTVETEEQTEYIRLSMPKGGDSR